MTSTTKNNFKKIIKILLIIIFWIGVWEIFSIFVNNNFLLPSVQKTAEELKAILISTSSYKIMLLTLLRVGLGFSLGVILGVFLGIVCQRIHLLDEIISPALLIIKSTPVASFIIILWITMSGNALSVFIAVLMVMPIIYQNVSDAYSSIDVNLSEVCDVFKFSKAKKFKLLVLPAITAYLVPAVITSLGLAWKAEIAAEIIAYTKSSIGQQINDAKFYMNTPRVFAWTIIVIVFSLIFEKIAKYFIRRFKNVNNH